MCLGYAECTEGDNLYNAEDNISAIIRVKYVPMNMKICVTDRKQRDKAK